MSQALRSLQNRKAELVTAMRALNDKAKSENRDLTDDEVKEFSANKEKLETINAAIDREQTMIAAEAELGNTSAGVIVVSENIEKDAKRGFMSFGEQAGAIARHYMGLGTDQRLAAAPSTPANEGTGADGGYSIAPQFSQEIWRLSLGEDSLIPYTMNDELTGNSMIYPKDETTPWGGTGVQAYWQSEAKAAAESKPVLGSETLTLHKLMCLVPVTNELLADSAALGSFLNNIAPERITWKTNEAILFGDGAGKPLGALTNAGNAGSPAIVVAKESGQAANTVDPKNLSNMVSRLLVGQLKTAIWLGTPDILTPLEAMTVGNYPIFLPNNNATEGSYGMLKGRPLFLTEHAAALSSQGDLSLVSLKGYRTITKAGGIQTATSMHLYFDADAMAFRFTFRINGKPIMSAPVTPPKSANKRSHFVVLGAR